MTGTKRAISTSHESSRRPRGFAYGIHVRVLLPVHMYLPEHRAGIETYTDQLARELAKTDDVTITTTRKIISLETGTIRRSTVNRIPVLEVVNNLSFDRFEDTWKNPVMESAFERVLDEVRPDVVHFQHLMYWSWGLPALARSRGARTLATLHDYWTICPRSQMIDWRGRLCEAPEESRCIECMANTPFGQPPAARKWIRRLTAVRRATGVALDEPMRWMQRHRARLARGRTRIESEREPVDDPSSVNEHAPAVDLGRWREAFHARRDALSLLGNDLDLAITPSKTLRDSVVAEGFPADRIRVIAQGLDSEPFSGIERNPSRGKLRLGFLGTLAPHKGVHVLLEAFQRLPADAVELRIWGPSNQHREYAERLHRMAQDSKNVHFLGALTKPEVPVAYKDVDVSCVPSLWNECCPLTIQESMMAGVPCVVSGRGGMAELIRDDIDGLHAIPGNVEDWERVLRRLLDEPDLVRRLGAAIRPVPTLAQHARELRGLYTRHA